MEGKPLKLQNVLGTGLRKRHEVETVEEKHPISSWTFSSFVNDNVNHLEYVYWKKTANNFKIAVSFKTLELINN